MRHDGADAAEFSDTTPAAEARYWARVRTTSPADRLRRALLLSDSLRTLTLSDVRRHAGAVSESDVATRFVRRVYGADTADSSVSGDVQFSTVSLEPTIALFGRELRAANVPYCVVGALASSWNGDPRATNDVDFVADTSHEKLSVLLSASITRAVVVEASADEYGGGQRVTLLDRLTLVKVDIFCVAGVETQRSSLARAEPHSVTLGEDTFELSIQSPEDTLLSNLRWYRHNGDRSDVYWRDARAVRTVHAALDEGYLLARAAIDGTGELLTKLSTASRSM